MEKKTVSYEEIRGCCPKVWVDGAERYWQRMVWETLEKAGMTKYDNEMERYEVLLHALAATKLFKNFCEVLMEGGEEAEVIDEAGHIGFTKDKIEKLYAYLMQEPFNDSLEYTEAFEMLVDRDSSDVIESLVDAWGFNKLFCTLYFSGDNGSDEEEYDDYGFEIEKEEVPKTDEETYAEYCNRFDKEFDGLIRYAESDWNAHICYSWLRQQTGM